MRMKIVNPLLTQHPPARHLFLILMLIVCHSATTLQAQSLVRLIIRDSLSHDALSGATMQHPVSQQLATSDAEGLVSMRIDAPGPQTFRLHAMGYRSRELQLSLPLRDSVTIIYMMPMEQALQEVRISTVRTNSRMEDIPTRVEVLGQEDMGEENGIKPGNILSLLGDIAGIQLQQVSASSGNTLARIQGLNGRYTQLLKDGIPSFGGLSGNFSILQIPPLDLKQIEIIKGSASTLYGGDAIGGTINLVSKLPTFQREWCATINQTSLRETNLNTYFAQRGKHTGLTFFGGQTWQRAVDVNGDGFSDVPDVRSTLIHPKWLIYINPKSTLTLNYTATFEERAGGDMRHRAAGSSDSLYFIRQNIQRHSGDAKWLYTFSKQSNLTFKCSGTWLRQTTENPFYRFNGGQVQYYTELSYVKQTARMNWVIGLNANGDQFTNHTAALSALQGYRYQTSGLFIQHTWKATKQLTVESGLRGDYHSRYGFFPLPRLSVMYLLNKQFTARVNGGMGYKIPNPVSHLNLETDLNRTTPATRLKAEHSAGINADVNYHHVFASGLNITLNQSVFFTQLRNPVYDSSTLAQSITLANAGAALQTSGLQSYARISYDEFELYLGYVFTDVKKQYDPVHPRPVVTPRHNLSGTIMYEAGEHWRVGLEGGYIAGQLQQDYRPARNYTIIAAMLQYKLPHLTFVLNGENLLDVRQTRYGAIYDGSRSNPQFHQLWAPIDGRVINLSVKWAL